ncbi:Putative ribonuclease H protein At1g65750 [Linum perenne]
MLRDCPLASDTWELLAFPSDNLAFFQTPLLSWIEDFIRRPELSLLFGVTCWFLWRYRNDRVFNGKLTTAVTLTRHIHVWVALVGDTLDRDRSVTDVVPPARTEVCISWEPAPPEWVTLNSDGSVNSESGQAAAGGLIRDYQGHCLAAFSENLGICSITRAELRGVVSGLQLAWDRGYRKVQLQIDSNVRFFSSSLMTVRIIFMPLLSGTLGNFSAAIGRFASDMFIVRVITLLTISLIEVILIPLVSIVSSFPILFFLFWLIHDQLGVSKTRLIMNES